MPIPTAEVWVRFYQTLNWQYQAAKYGSIPKNASISSIGGFPVTYGDIIIFALDVNISPLGHFIVPHRIKLPFVPIALVRNKKVVVSIPAPEGCLYTLEEYLKNFNLVD